MTNKTLKFITGNKGKVKEMSEILAPIQFEQVDIDLDEIQELDPYKIIEHKLKEALKHHQKNFFIEDTCVFFEAFKYQLPGPLMKWFLHSLKPKGLYELAKKVKNFNAKILTIIAYVKNSKEIYYFEGSVKGKIVRPKGAYGFGFDPIFIPGGSHKTLAEIKGGSPEIYAKVSARGRGAIKFKKFLLNEAKRETKGAR